MVKNGKPAPDLFLHAARTMGVDGANCLVIEDSVSGVTAARAAGMCVFGFCGGTHCRPGHAQDLIDHGAVLVFDEMRRLPELIVR
jgi:beta-phosphoglucomutase-like phosphatase (HAD superfamily)